MKGFAATPVIFIAVFIITAILFMHFMDIDKQVAEGIGKEARLRKLQADFLKNQTSAANELYACGSFYAQYTTDLDTLAQRTGQCVNRTVRVRNDGNCIRAEYDYGYDSGTLIDASLNRNATVSACIK